MNFHMIIDVAKLGIKYPKHEAAFADIIKDLSNTPDLTPNQAEELIGKWDGKIQMIRAYRERTGAGLLEAKQMCENHFSNRGFSFQGT